ncbi:unnamed protein product [Tenebrio molitor]|nr:unnamed protein product [Tenebrio molitor]
MFWELRAKIRSGSFEWDALVNFPWKIENTDGKTYLRDMGRTRTPTLRYYKKMEQKRYAVKTSLLQELRLRDKKNVLQRGIFQQQWVLLSQEYYEQEKEE